MNEIVCYVVTVMGHVVVNQMQLFGHSKSPRVSKDLRDSLALLDRVAEKSSHLTDREKLHVTAVQQFAGG